MAQFESFNLSGAQLLDKVKALIAEGNVRKIVIHSRDGKELMSFPLTVGVVGAVLAPVLAAIGALAALVGDCTLSVERTSGPTETPPPDVAPADEPRH